MLQAPPAQNYADDIATTSCDVGDGDASTTETGLTTQFTFAAVRSTVRTARRPKDRGTRRTEALRPARDGVQSTVLVVRQKTLNAAARHVTYTHAHSHARLVNK